LAEIQEKTKENDKIKRDVDRIEERVENIGTHVHASFKGVNNIAETRVQEASKSTPYKANN
jgi:hypothetical protein